MTPDYLGDVLEAIDSGCAVPAQHLRTVAETVRTLLGEVVALSDREASLMNRRLAPYGLVLGKAEALPEAEAMRSRVRVRMAAKGLRRRLPELLFAVSPHNLPQGEILATVGTLSLPIGTRHPGVLAAGVERALAELAGAGLRRLAELRGVHRPGRADGWTR